MVLVDIKPPRLKVRVSCCDADLSFVNKLVLGLVRYGRYDVSVTPEQQAERTGWKERIGALIAEADTVLFVLSSEAVGSQAFIAEAERAGEFSKRMYCVIASPLRISDVPAPLAGLKHRRFDQEPLFDGNLELLAALLDADADWVRMHTQLFDLASKWKNSGYAEHHLLTGADIKTARTWTFGRPFAAPKPTVLHVQFIQASEVVHAAGGNALIGSPLHNKRARRKVNLQEPLSSNVSRRSRPVLAMQAKRPSSAQSTTPLARMGEPLPVPLYNEPAQAQPVLAGLRPEPVGQPLAEMPAPDDRPTQLGAQPTRAVTAKTMVFDHDELDELVLDLPPGDDDEVSVASAEDADDEPHARISIEALCDDTAGRTISDPAPDANDDAACAPDQIDLRCTRSIPGIQKDLAEIAPDDFLLNYDARAQHGQNRLIAVMASSLVVVASIAIWQMVDYSRLRASANNPTWTQFAELSSLPGDHPMPRRKGNLIERAMDKVECLLQPSAAQDGKCLTNLRRSGEAEPNYQ